MEHREDFLGLAEGEERDEHAGAALEGGFDRPGEAQLLVGPGERVGRGAITARRFDDEHIQLVLGETRALHDGLIIELHVARVENGAAMRADERADGAENVARVEELEGQVGVFANGKPFARVTSKRVWSGIERQRFTATSASR